MSINQEVGLPELSTNPRDWGLSLVNVAGFSSLGHEFNNPQQGRTNHWQIGDTLTWTTGRHLLRFGGEARLVRQEAFRDVQSRGLLSFTSQAFTGNALADLLLGLPTVTVGATLDNPQNLRASSYAAFVQDSFEVSPTRHAFSGRPLRAQRAARRRRRSRHALRPRDRDARARRHQRDAACRLRGRSQQLRAAPRAGVDGARVDGRARRLRHLVRPGRTRAERVPVLQCAVLQPQHLLHAAGCSTR